MTVQLRGLDHNPTATTKTPRYKDDQNCPAGSETESGTIARMNDDVLIQPAQPDEREWAAELMASSDPWIILGRGLGACRLKCDDPDYHLFVAHTDGRPCGFVLIHPKGMAGAPYIASIAVAEDFRRRGIGARLLDFAEDLFRGRARFMFLCVSSFNVRARALYERLGYSAVGELKDYVIDGASEHLMGKRLRHP
jgi:ribosomal-protein-alanine N-acetyltransferase